ncbi:MAG TPA: GxxExxY protein [Tepidisphaeraceae bacterium]|jgi:GxxExxY protein|nr:GxxExxY protein [Tepidisphaeraceae bacterium]
MEPIPDDLDRIGTQIVDAAFHLHSKLGPGLLESVYEACLAHDLRKRGLRVERQVPIQLQYDDLTFNEAFRLDLLVEGVIIIELKSTLEDHPVYKSQLLTYLRLSNLRLGYLINFNKKYIKDGITRVAL